MIMLSLVEGYVLLSCRVVSLSTEEMISKYHRRKMEVRVMIGQFKCEYEQ